MQWRVFVVFFLFSGSLYYNIVVMFYFHKIRQLIKRCIDLEDWWVRIKIKWKDGIYYIVIEIIDYIFVYYRNIVYNFFFEREI